MNIYAEDVGIQVICKTRNNIWSAHTASRHGQGDGSRISFSMSYDGTATKWDKVQRPDIAHRLSMCTPWMGMEI